MSIYCKRHIQCSLVSTQPHKAFDFVLTLCLCVHRHQIICDLTWAERDMWLGQSWLGHTLCQTELSLVETRPMHVWGCDSGITCMPSRVNFTTLMKTIPTKCTTTCNGIKMILTRRFWRKEISVFATWQMNSINVLGAGLGLGPV